MVIVHTDNDPQREDWRRRPWAIVLLILLAVAFGGQLVLIGPTVALIPTAALLFGWTGLLILNLRRSAG